MSTIVVEPRHLTIAASAAYTSESRRNARIGHLTVTMQRLDGRIDIPLKDLTDEVYRALADRLEATACLRDAMALRAATSGAS